MLSRTLTNEGLKQNAIISEQSITAIIIYPRLSAVPQTADKVRYTIRLLFRPKGDDTRDPIKRTKYYHRCQMPSPNITEIEDSPPDMTLSPSHILQLPFRSKPNVITNVT